MRFRVMNYTGDSETEYAPEQLADAMAEFERLLKEEKQIAGARKAGEHEYNLVRSFDPTADEYVFSAARKGG